MIHFKVPMSQTESGLALGLNRKQLFFEIILPEALSISVPGIVANIIFLLKETSVFPAISPDSSQAVRNSGWL